MKLLLPGMAALALVMGGASAATAPDAASLANGRTIFLTGHDSAGTRITAAKPPLRPSCTACHRADGSGGVRVTRNAVSADLRHKAMATGDHPYTLALIERAVSAGIDNDGKPLDLAMPRWKMSAHDLHDVAAYVLTRL